jgi:hypothetical protein
MAQQSDAMAALAAKAQPAAPVAAAPQPQAQPAPDQQDQDADAETAPKEPETPATANIKRDYGVLNEKLIALFDGSGVKRSFTVPYVAGQETGDHVQAVGKAATQVGGFAKNVMMSAHAHSSGAKYGDGNGQTVGHPADKLRSTIIPKNDEKATAVIVAAQKLLKDLESVTPKNEKAHSQTAMNQLGVVKKTNGEGMNLLDFGVFMINLAFLPLQALARAHARVHPSGNPLKHQPARKHWQAGAGAQPPQAGAQPQIPAAPATQPPAPEAQ